MASSDQDCYEHKWNTQQNAHEANVWIDGGILSAIELRQGGTNQHTNDTAEACDRAKD